LKSYLKDTTDLINFKEKNTTIVLAGICLLFFYATQDRSYLLKREGAMICEKKGNLVYMKWHDKRDVNI